MSPGTTDLLEAVPGSAALVHGQGRLESQNRDWSQARPGNPFLDGVAPGSDYLQHCQGLTRSASGEVALVAMGIVSAITGKLKQLNLEYPILVNGDTRWFAMTATATEDSGTVIAHLDVTERMLWEKRMRRSDQLFRATTENAQDLSAVLRADGTALYTSPSYGKTLGYAPGAMLSWKPVLTVFEADSATFKENCLKGFLLGVSPSFEYRVRHADGSTRYLEARAVAVENAVGDPDAILLTSRDISAMKEAEAEQARMEVELRHSQKMEAIGQLAAGIAHEINTPCQYLSDNMGFLADAFASLQEVLAGLEGPLGLGLPELAALTGKMAEQDVPYLLEEIPRAITQSREGLSRISTIVRAMKVFAHPGGEGCSAVNLNQALENTLVVAQSEWKYVAEVDTDLDPDLPTVVCSPGELNQVFLNLIVNAAHAIGERGLREKGRISVSTRALGSGVEIRIRDTGAGIPEAIRDQIFLPFFTTKEVGKGTGQGLAIAHSVVARHGGSIGFESVLGQGTCFIVTLPFSPAAAP